MTTPTDITLAREEPLPSIATLSARARALRTASINQQRDESLRDDAADYSFNSRYETVGGPPRAWCNWLVTDWLILGQYPHHQPDFAADAKRHLRNVLNANVTCFACVMKELPPQDDESSWSMAASSAPATISDGGGGGGLLRQLLELIRPPKQRRPPIGFVPYKDDADAIAREIGRDSPLTYLYCPLVDMEVPKGGLADGSPLLVLLDGILKQFENGGSVYLHCRAGRGRAGLVGACTLALLRPEMSADAVLDAVQAGYDSRGAHGLPGGAGKSPQTAAQRAFVRRFVSAVQQVR